MQAHREAARAWLPKRAVWRECQSARRGINTRACAWGTRTHWAALTPSATPPHQHASAARPARAAGSHRRRGPPAPLPPHPAMPPHNAGGGRGGQCVAGSKLPATHCRAQLNAPDQVRATASGGSAPAGRTSVRRGLRQAAAIIRHTAAYSWLPVAPPDRAHSGAAVGGSGQMPTMQLAMRDASANLAAWCPQAQPPAGRA